MADFKNFSDSVQVYNIEPTVLTDVLPGDITYMGVSLYGNNINAATWRIKKISLNGTVWSTQYPNNDQSYIFVWNDRTTYTYS